jgi:hypothetical protein
VSSEDEVARTVAATTGTSLEELLGTAARVAGLDALTLVAGLGGSPRSLVGRVTDGADTYVVKVTGLQEGDTWARESSALAAADGSGVSPRLLGSDAATRLIVMSDLGSAPPVSDRLMGGTPAAADAGLVAWAVAIARLHEDGDSRAHRYAELLHQRAPGQPAHALPAMLDEAVVALERNAAALGVTGAGAALGRLREVPDRFATDRVVLSPGDACPDNNVVRADGAGADHVVLLDFEYAEARHPAWDLAYLTVPWPTCWCSWQLSPVARERAVAAYLERAGLTGDRDFAGDLALATQGWALATAARLLDPALVDDAWDVPEMPSPRLRAWHRLETAAAASGDDVLSALAGEMLGALRQRWGPQPLPLAPAYRG